MIQRVPLFEKSGTLRSDDFEKTDYYIMLPISRSKFSITYSFMNDNYL